MATSPKHAALDHAALDADVLAELKQAMTKNISKYSEMTYDMQSEAVDIIISAIDKHQSNTQSAAKHIKHEMDKKFGKSWHCVIGEGFGFFITHQKSNILYMFYQGNMAILLFKC